MSGLPQVLCKKGSITKACFCAHAAKRLNNLKIIELAFQYFFYFRLQLWNLRKMVPHKICSHKTRANPYRGTAVPMRSMLEKFRTKRNLIPTPNDPYRWTAVHLSPLSERLQSKRATETSHSHALKLRSERHTIVLLQFVSESFLSRVWIKQAFGHAYRKNFQVQWLRENLYGQEFFEEAPFADWPPKLIWCSNNCVPALIRLLGCSLL